MCTLSLHDALPIYSDLRIPSSDKKYAEKRTGAEVKLGRPVLKTLRVDTSLQIEKVDDSREPGEYWNNSIGLGRSEEHTSELQSRPHLVCRLQLEKKKQRQGYGQQQAQQGQRPAGRALHQKAQPLTQEAIDDPCRPAHPAGGGSQLFLTDTAPQYPAG